MKKILLTSVVFAGMLAVVFGAPALTSAAENDACVAHSITVVSDESNLVQGGGSAVETYDDSIVWAHIPGAKWIWETAFVQNPASQETVVITKEFNIVGSPATSTLSILADDFFRVSVNGTEFASDFVGLNFMEAKNYSNVESLLVSGTNTVSFEITNLAYDGDYEASAYNNPSGVAYSLDVQSVSCPDSEGGNNGGGRSGGRRHSSEGGQGGDNDDGSVIDTVVSTVSSFGPMVAGLFDGDEAGATSTEEAVLGTSSAATTTKAVFPEGMWCVLSSFLAALLLYVAWLLLVSKKRDQNAASAKNTILKDIAFFLISGVVLTIVLVLLAWTCPIIPLWIFLAIIAVSIFFKVL